MDCRIREDITQISVGDIVTSLYTDIRGDRKVGLFLVVYTEENDPNDYNNRNVTGLKLTSKDLYANVYRTLVTTRDVPKLTNNSYIYSNKLSTLLVSNCRYVAPLPSDLYEEVLDKLYIYLNQLQTQSSKALINKIKGGK